MATSIESLFGVTPEDLMASRDLQAQKDALAYAQLTGAQRANMGGFLAGRQLGGALGGLLGAQDPELERIRQRQALLQGVDLSSPEALRAAASRALQSGDSAAAGLLAARAMEADKARAELGATQALTAQRLRERAAADPLQQLLRTGKYTPESVAKYQETGNIKDLETVQKDDPTALSETAEGIFLVNKRTGEKIARVGSSPERGTRVTVAPEIKQAPDIVGAINAADKALEPEINMINSSRLAKELINQTANSNNSQTWEAARTTVAKAVGENKLSNEDIRRTGVDPRLVQGALDWVNKKIEGVPSQDIQKQLFVLASVLERNAASRYDAKTNRMREAGKAANFPGNPATYFPTAAERGLTTPAPAAAGNVVDWNSLKK